MNNQMLEEVVMTLRFPIKPKASRRDVANVVKEVKSLLDEWGYEYTLIERSELARRNAVLAALANADGCCLDTQEERERVADTILRALL